jgi:hypothetical protein
VDHIHTVLERDADDVVLGKVSGDGGEALTNLIGFIGLPDA